ncbi:hypothetical protein PWT90_03934 [Aphanocladium album]|nr:hypothetical protein PWT90_03934 [Aphanocladium album]
MDDQVTAFLQQHPQVLVGREAWEGANKGIELDDTFSAIGKPLPNVVIMQTVSSITKKALVVAALIHDDKVEAYYREIAAPRVPTKCECPQGNCDAWRKRCFLVMNFTATNPTIPRTGEKDLASTYGLHSSLLVDTLTAMATANVFNPAQLPLDQQLTHLRTILSTNKTLLTVLDRFAILNMPNWYVAAGAVSQTIWNHMSGMAPDTGISDYDVVYHDSDLSWEAEDRYIQTAKELFSDMPDIEIEIRNQARVHLWYEDKYGVECAPHKTVEAGIDSWISTSAMIGIRLNDDGSSWSVYAPRGLSDYFNMVARPNDSLGLRENYDKKAERWKGIWDKLTVEPWPTN